MAQSTTTPDGGPPPILIIGAGVAGLALAQGLRLRSVPFRVFERRARSRSSQGHRFRVSGDGQAALDGVLSPPLRDLLRRTAADRHRFEPRYVDAARLDHGSPTPVDPETMPIDRTWIRLLATLGIQDAIEYEKEFASYEVIGERVQVTFADGSVARGRLLVGADGIKSRVRKQLQPDRKLLDLERWVMWGRTPLTEELRESTPQDLLSWCMYQDQEANTQAVVEPMTWSKSVRQESKAALPDFADYVYWVVCTASFQYAESLPKTVEEKRLFLERVTETWHPALKFLLDGAVHDLSACVPVLSSRPDIEIRSTGQTGRVTLIGDAAHPMSPMGGAGGDTAIRNAADLARIVAEKGVTKSSMADFELLMEARAKEKIEHSFRGGQKFWRGKEWTEYNETSV
ncbi:FAD/NAD(P)-binding domain-containing protein [Biscogniauxia mediterranea]|nr:FAD/NAD(P)-binding domain-containing protein [Biscogniauxia mediterranea]